MFVMASDDQGQAATREEKVLPPLLQSAMTCALWSPGSICRLQGQLAPTVVLLPLLWCFCTSG